MESLWQLPSSLSESQIQAIFWIAGVLVTLFIIATLFITTYRLLAQLKQEQIKHARLQQEAQRLTYAFQGSSDGIWDWDVKNRRLYCSTRLMEIMGFNSDSNITEVEDDFLLLRIHPEDELHVQSLVKTHLQKDTALNFEARLRNRKGNYFWVHIRGKSTELDANNRIVRTCGVIKDIDEIKQQELDRQLSAVAFESSEGIAVISHQFFIVKTNQAFSQITGFSSEEILSKTPDVLRADSVETSVLKDFWLDAKKHGFSQLKTWFKHKNNQQYPVMARLNRVNDSQGNCTHIVLFFQNISEQLQYESQIKRMAFYDELTQLPNRRLFIDRLDRALARMERTKHVGALIYVDLDHFKEVNDTWGHQTGDALLLEVSKRLSFQVRSEDTLARIGGDEFVILMPEIAEDSQVATVILEKFCERILAELNVPFSFEQANMNISASLGISMFPFDGITLDDLMKQADTAMYSSKQKGRGTWHFYSSEIQLKAQERKTLQVDLQQAITNNQIHVHFLPQYICRDNLIFGFEALLRWQHPTLGLIKPSSFVEHAEFSGQIVELDQLALRQVLVVLEAWNQHGLLGDNFGYISINLSRRYFMQLDFVQSVMAILQPYRHLTKYLCLELREDYIFNNLTDALKKMNRVRGLGVHFAIDNFGTGQASLANLAKLPLSQIKIARQFLDEDPLISTSVLQSIIGLAQSLSIPVAA